MVDDDSVPCTVAPGYMGNKDQWCYWESEYPEEGVTGPFASAEEATEYLDGYAKVSRTPMHVERVLTFEECERIFNKSKRC